MKLRVLLVAAMAHVIASYASMVILGALALEVDHHFPKEFVRFILAAPISMPFLVTRTIAGALPFTRLAAIVVIAAYISSMIVIWLWRRRPHHSACSQGFPMDPNGNVPTVHK